MSQPPDILPDSEYEPPTSAIQGTSLQEKPLYFPVSTAKLVVMATVTFGLYEVYWFYKNWEFVRRRDLSDIWPVWRAVFGALWYHALMKDIETHHESQPGAGRTISPIFLALTYFALAGAAWKLADPYWLVAFASVLCLVPTGRRIADLPGQDASAVRSHSRFGALNIVGIVLLGPMALIIVTGSLHLTPSSQTVAGSRLWPWQMAFLREEGYLDESEELVCFYSNGLLSIAEDGNIVTDRSLVSYFSDPESGELYSDFAYYEDMADVSVSFAESFLDYTEITVKKRDEETFDLWLSPEAEKDIDCVDTLKKFHREARSKTGETAR